MKVDNNKLVIFCLHDQFLKLGHNMMLNHNLLMVIFVRETILVKVHINKLVIIFYLSNNMTRLLKIVDPTLHF